jgi:hypothetical protein
MLKDYFNRLIHFLELPHLDKIHDIITIGVINTGKIKGAQKIPPRFLIEKVVSNPSLANCSVSGL